MLGVLESIHAFLEANKVVADVGLCHLSGLQMGSLCVLTWQINISWLLFDMGINLNMKALL